MTSLKKLAGQTAVYGLSSILARAINFLLVPFYTQYMPAKAFGILSEYMVYIAFFIVVLTFGLETTYFRYAQEEDEEPKIFSQLFTYIFSGSFVICLCVYLFSSQLQSVLGSTGNQSYIQLMAGILFLDALSALPFARIRNQNKSLKFVVIKVSSILLNVFLNLLFIWYLPLVLGLSNLSFLGFNLDLTNQVALILLANLLANSIYFIFFFNEFKLLFKHWDKKYIKPVLSYAYPIMFLGLAGLVNELIDRLMLKELLPKGFYAQIGVDNIEALGIYSANYKFAIFITLAIQAYRYAAEPFFFKAHKDKNSPETFSKLMTLFTLILLVAATMISVFKVEIGFLILRNEIYRTGLNVVPILLMANVCVGVYYNLSAWYKLTDKTIFGTLIGVGGAILTFVLNIVLIPYYGYMGCAIATFVCYASMMIVSYVLGQKYYPLPYQAIKIVIYFLASGAIIALSSFYIESLMYAFYFKLALILIALGALYKIELKPMLKA